MSDEETLHDDVEAYTLATLDREAALALEAAMRDSPALRRQVAEARAVVAALAESPAQLSPSPHLRARLLASVRADVEAYALGTLNRDEAREIERQASGSADVQERVREARAVVQLLATSPEQLSPSAELRSRVLAAARADRQRSAAPPPQPGAAEAGRRGESRPLLARSVAPSRSAGGWLRRPPSWMTLAAAACLLLSIGLGAWNIALQQEVSRQRAELERDRAALQVAAGADRFWTMRGEPAHAPAAVSTLALNLSRRQAVLVARGFPPLPPDQAYQVWVVQNNRQVPVGSFAPLTLAGEQALVLPSDLAGVTAAMITIEPAGGSPRPTGPIVMGGDL
jgi:anti-sigma-K factor RskA